MQALSDGNIAGCIRQSQKPDKLFFLVDTNEGICNNGIRQGFGRMLMDGSIQGLPSTARTVSSIGETSELLPPRRLLTGQ